MKITINVTERELVAISHCIDVLSNNIADDKENMGDDYISPYTADVKHAEKLENKIRKAIKRARGAE